MLAANAEIIDYFVREVVGLKTSRSIPMTGVSIGLAFLGNYLTTQTPAIRSIIIFIKQWHVSAAGQSVARSIENARYRHCRPNACFPCGAGTANRGEPESLAYSDIFAFKQGNVSLIYVGRYFERQTNEVRWLENLPRSPVPVVYLWGLADNVHPPRIAHHVWDTYLNDRQAKSNWVLPTAGTLSHQRSRRSSESHSASADRSKLCPISGPRMTLCGATDRQGPPRMLSSWGTQRLRIGFSKFY